jgi:hypothetical protein
MLGFHSSKTSESGTDFTSAPFSTNNWMKSSLRRETASASAAFFDDWFFPVKPSKNVTVAGVVETFEM